MDISFSSSRTATSSSGPTMWWTAFLRLWRHGLDDLRERSEEQSVYALTQKLGDRGEGSRERAPPKRRGPSQDDGAGEAARPRRAGSRWRRWGGRGSHSRGRRRRRRGGLVATLERALELVHVLQVVEVAAGFLE